MKTCARTQEKLLVQKYIELRNAEESFIKQRSRVKMASFRGLGTTTRNIFTRSYALTELGTLYIVSFQHDAGVVNHLVNPETSE